MCGIGELPGDVRCSGTSRVRCATGNSHVNVPCAGPSWDSSRLEGVVCIRGLETSTQIYMETREAAFRASCGLGCGMLAGGKLRSDGPTPPPPDPSALPTGPRG